MYFFLTSYYLTGENSIISQLLAEYKSSIEDSASETQKKNKQTAGISNCSQKPKTSFVQNPSVGRVDIQEILKKSVITPDFEKLHSVPMYDVSDKKLREQRRVNIYLFQIVHLIY